MADNHDAAEHHGPTFKTYLIIFGALSVFTLVSFVANAMVYAGQLTAYASMAIIMTVAVCKATLVCMYFMHLKYEWSKLYFLIVPVGILAVMMIIVLWPDGVAGWHLEPETTAVSAGNE